MSEKRKVMVHIEFDMDLEADIHLEGQDIIGIINEMDYDFAIDHPDVNVMETEMCDCSVNIFEEDIKRIIDSITSFYLNRDFNGIMKKVVLLQKFLTTNQESLDIDPIPYPPKIKKRRKDEKDDLGKLAENILGKLEKDDLGSLVEDI
jgi:hypothetical protein